MKEALVIWYGDPETAKSVVSGLERVQGKRAVDLAEAKKKASAHEKREERPAETSACWNFRASASRKTVRLKTMKDYGFGYYLMCVYMLVFTAAYGVCAWIWAWILWAYNKAIE